MHLALSSTTVVSSNILRCNGDEMQVSGGEKPGDIDSPIVPRDLYICRDRAGLTYVGALFSEIMWGPQAPHNYGVGAPGPHTRNIIICKIVYYM